MLLVFLLLKPKGKRKKREDFLDFSEVVKLVENKAHLTREGLDQISLIKGKMNKNR